MDDQAALADSLSVAFLVLLESLSPVERAVFLLRDAFDYDYAEIARIVDKSEANCRQQMRRARQKIADRPRRFDVPREQLVEMMERFFRAANTGDLDSLLDLLTEDVTLWSDGGGKTAAARNPIHGADRVARFFTGLMRKAPASLTLRPAIVNGEPGLLSYIGGKPYSVLTFELEGERFRNFRIIVNPDKLRHVPPQP
jgi:RNA polymerase sigma-70 factor (ECF subfamily)